MKINKKIIALPVLMGAFVLAGAAHNAQAATTTATLNIQNFTQVSASASVSATPTLSDIQSHSVESVGGITLGVTTNNATGCKVTVAAGSGDVSTSKIAAADIKLKSSDTGTDAAFADYNSLSTSAADLWNTDSPSVDPTDVTLDVLFNNLHQYPAVAGATKQYTNTITFTAVANS